MKPEYEEKIEKYKKGWLSGLTCHNSTKRTLFWQSGCGRFIIMKHWSHSCYGGRMGGSSNCCSRHDLFDLDKEFNWKNNYGKGEPIKSWEGRWKKSLFEEANRAIDVYLNPPTEEEIRERRRLKPEARAKKVYKGRIIIFKEKYGNYIFSAETNEKLWDVALHVFLRRYKEGPGWYPYNIEHILSKNTIEEYHKSEEKLENLRKDLEIAESDEVKRLIQNAIDKVLEVVKGYENAVKYVDRINKIKETNDRYDAWCLMDERINYEYEGFEMDVVRDIEDDN